MPGPSSLSPELRLLTVPPKARDVGGGEGGHGEVLQAGSATEGAGWRRGVRATWRDREGFKHTWPLRAHVRPFVGLILGHAPGSCPFGDRRAVRHGLGSKDMGGKVPDWAPGLGA